MPDADTLKILAGLGAAGLLTWLFKPLISAVIRSLEKMVENTASSQAEFVKNQTIFATALQQVVSTLEDIRENMRSHIQSDQQTDAEIAARLRLMPECRYVPGSEARGGDPSPPG